MVSMAFLFPLIGGDRRRHRLLLQKWNRNQAVLEGLWLFPVAFADPHMRDGIPQSPHEAETVCCSVLDHAFR